MVDEDTVLIYHTAAFIAKHDSAQSDEDAARKGHIPQSYFHQLKAATEQVRQNRIP